MWRSCQTTFAPPESLGRAVAGFPSYMKWTNLDEVDFLLVNHRESEPNCYSGKWLAREHANFLAAGLNSLLDASFEAVVIGTKARYCDDGWMEELKAVTDATAYGPADLPVDVNQESVIVASTSDVYTYSEEPVLLMVAAGVQTGNDLPTEHSWIVYNTETLYNIVRALRDGTPVTKKYVHVDGNTPQHRCLKVPIGTTATTLLEAASVPAGMPDDDQVLVDGGPGWCYEIEPPLEEFGVRKRTNAVIMVDQEVTEEHREPDGQIDLLDRRDWASGDHEMEPTELVPDFVRIPLITNAAYRGFVEPSKPVVKVGNAVSEGDVIAKPNPNGNSNPQHASIDGTVVDVTNTHIVIDR